MALGARERFGVDYAVAPGASGPPTARSLIVVTPDAARTMNTFLGISSLLHPDEIDEELVASAKGLFLIETPAGKLPRRDPQGAAVAHTESRI